METFIRPLTITALAAACVLSLSGAVQAATPAQAAAPVQQSVSPGDDDDHNQAFDKTSMMFEESGKKGAYSHSKEAQPEELLQLLG
ncbi:MULTISPECIES: hypothetical protein [unclassified Streptomyces]|uniref:hypothetical protein n=1 Tax=unclassified Streptomyces TaxID=2593676 RepID=UPI000DC7C5D9|nr:MULTISPECIES: hypothetical protein [unclassified Streptomyces]AWZ06646.1 hypothetical protein DRB89_20750 [Streptomyces sp. ICC4]AWZ14373.1 hypothetical protein DRB96_21245 [Streptomyces sp. ICC1]